MNRDFIKASLTYRPASSAAARAEHRYTQQNARQRAGHFAV